MTKLDHARRYIEIGWYVLPVHGAPGGVCRCHLGAACKHPGKHPATEHGSDDATADVATVERWFKRGDYNMGAACSPSGFIALDVDGPRPGNKHTDGREELAHLTEELGPLPVTVTADTGSGALHMLYRSPGGETVGRIGRAIDVKHSGMIVVEPSIHVSGTPYRWQPGRAPWEIAVADLPPVWVEFLRKPEPAEQAPRSTTSNADGDDFFAALASLNQREVLETISGSWIVNGERFAFKPKRNGSGRYNLLVDRGDGWELTFNFIAADGTIAARSSTKTGSPDGGPLVSTWLRYYGWDDQKIYNALIELVPAMAEFVERRAARRKAEHSSRTGPMEPSIPSEKHPNAPHVNGSNGARHAPPPAPPACETRDRADEPDAPPADDAPPDEQEAPPPRDERDAVNGDESENAPGKGKGKKGKKSGEADKEPSTASKLVKLTCDCAELWHTPEGDLYATVKIKGHMEHMRLGSKSWRLWLAHAALTGGVGAVGSSPLNDATGVLQGIAQYQGAEHRTYLRIASLDDRIYIDLCDKRWRAVEIDRDGWRIVERPPVRFERHNAMAALPDPVPGGSFSEMRNHVQISDESWPLVAGWLVGALAPQGPYPVLTLRGQHGAGKSMGAKRARSLIDPSHVPIRSPPREPRDLVITACKGHVYALDNLSFVPQWLSDGLCRLATGGGYAARALYTDSDEIVIDVQRPAILTGITDVVSAPDLLDRCLLVDLEAIAPEDRETERRLNAAWDKVQPGILGALYTAVSTALKRRDEMKFERLPRLADWAAWATAAEPALGLADGEVTAALAAQAGEATEIAIDASIVARPICDMMASWTEDEWSGTATKLLTDLTARVPNTVERDKAWPRTPRGMTAALARIAPALAEHGLRVEKLPRGHGGVRHWRIAKIKKPEESS